jgi:hypothetical protein
MYYGGLFMNIEITMFLNCIASQLCYNEKPNSSVTYYHKHLCLIS